MGSLSVENTSFSTMSLCSPVRYIYCYLLWSIGGTPTPFYFHSAWKQELCCKGPGSHQFYSTLKEKKDQKHTSSHSLGFNFFDFCKSFDYQQKAEHFKTIVPLLKGYPHHRELMNDTYIWISEYPFISFSFFKGNHWDPVCRTSEVLHQDPN